MKNTQHFLKFLAIFLYGNYHEVNHSSGKDGKIANFNRYPLIEKESPFQDGIHSVGFMDRSVTACCLHLAHKQLMCVLYLDEVVELYAFTHISSFPSKKFIKRNYCVQLNMHIKLLLKCFKQYATSRRNHNT